MNGNTIRWNNQVKQFRIEDLPEDEQERIRNLKAPTKEQLRTTAAQSVQSPTGSKRRHSTGGSKTQGAR